MGGKVKNKKTEMQDMVSWPFGVPRLSLSLPLSLTRACVYVNVYVCACVEQYECEGVMSHMKASFHT